MVGHDPLIKQLQDERNALAQRVDAIDSAIRALTGSDPVPIGRPDRPHSVGDDKVEAIRDYVRSRGTVRQADITRDLGLNSGTVSEGVGKLIHDGVVERGPKVDRSPTVRYVK